jgi:superfamily II DNA or RNA helicase
LACNPGTDQNVKKVTIIRQGNRIAVHPTTARIRKLLIPRLRIKTKKYGEIATDVLELFTFDAFGHLTTFYGLTTRVVRTLENAGYFLQMADIAPADESKFIPDWSLLAKSGLKLRPYQAEILAAMFSYDHGRIDAAPGVGKTTIAVILGIVCPKLKIHFVCKELEVVKTRALPEFKMYLPSVGLIGDQVYEPNKRILLISADSMHRAPTDADICIIDECHRSGAPRFSENLLKYRRARMWGLSASQDMRMDNRNLVVEALTGPIRYTVPYEEGVKAGIIVPIHVKWTSVRMDVNPIDGIDDPVEKKREGFWCNPVRNELIAKAARRYKPDTQVLITCETIEHAVRLKKLLPEFTLVYSANGMDWKRRSKYVKKGLLSESERTMTPARRKWLTKQFEQGKLKKVIVTTVWNAGVSMNYLEVLIRADGGSSRINDVQIPGRVSRINSKGKNVGVLHDFCDCFDSGMLRRSASRMRSYKRQRWSQTVPLASLKAIQGMNQRMPSFGE